MYKIIALLLGFFSSVRISFVGQLMGSEILSIILFPLSKIRKLFFDYKNLSNVVKYLSLLLFFQVLSDVYNTSDFQDYSRGISTIIFSAISTIFFVHLLSKNLRLFPVLILGIVISKIIFGNFELTESAYYFDDELNLFKSRIVPILNYILLITIYFFSKRKNYFIVFLLITTYGIISITLGARSNGLVYLLSSFFLLFKYKLFGLYKISFYRRILILVPLFYFFYGFYVDLVSKNDFGGLNSKNQIQLIDNIYNPFELLYYGRTETFVAISAIIEKPIIGYGSWAKDHSGKFQKLMEEIKGVSITKNASFIPSHSVFFGAWLYSGIFGALSILLVFITIVKSGIIYYKFSFDEFTPVVLILLVEFIWAFFFSPFGILRTTFPLMTSIIIINHKKLFSN